MRFQTSLLSLFLLVLVLASYVDASTKKRKKKKGKKKKVPILSDDSTERGETFTLLSSSMFEPKPKSKSKSKPKIAPMLVDTTNTPPAVQLEDQGILMQGSHKENQVSKRYGQTKIFEGLINKKQYEEIAELGRKMDDEDLLKCLCQIVTTVGHFKGLYGYMEERNMVTGFLAHGDIMLIRKVIAETGLLSMYSCGRHESIYDAIVLSLNEDCHERVADLLGAGHEKPAWKGNFSMFVNGFFRKYCPEKYDMPFKRLLALHGEEFSTKHPAIFEAICQKLVSWWQSDDLVSQKLLTDLVGQPSLLTPAAFVLGVLYGADDAPRTRLIKHGYKEALEEGLKEAYPDGSRKLWAVMVKTLPNQFSGKYPSTDEARTAALKDFKPTKQDREREWIRKNAPNLRMKLEILVPDLLPTVLLGIVSEYAITWVAFLWSPQQKQLRPPVNEQIAEKFETLMNEKRYGEVVELANSMENDTLAKHLYPLMTTAEHCKYLNGYLNSRDMMPDFLALAEIGIVRKTILEFDIDSDYYILQEDMFDAFTLSIKEHRDDRAINLLRIERERHATADEQRKKVGKAPQFEVIVHNFCGILIEREITAPLKRFLTICREELDEGHPNIFEIMCQGIVSRLRANSGQPGYKKLLTDFVGQSSMITHTTFAYGFLGNDFDGLQPDFIKYWWREAIQEGLKGRRPGDGRVLWSFITRTYPNRFSGEYPDTDEERIAAVRSFKTKQDLELEWAKENALIFSPKLVAKLQESDILIILPQTLWNIIAEYAATGATWVDV